MKCPECQHDNPEGEKFCNECGESLKLQGESVSIDVTQPHTYTPKFSDDKILTTQSAWRAKENG